ncbi:helix-turn-helix domain-containing protein [Streptomyces sp. NPDC000983]|uniref:helix-turn-helix domain-containing protein n=1 Tax=Streptomyces sp. NPDC000983 TaxID=3154373 RepID=UPI0033282341
MLPIGARGATAAALIAAAAVAKRPGVHPNTPRYRIRRAVAPTGLDLDDPEDRPAATLRLRLDLTEREPAGTASPATEALAAAEMPGLGSMPGMPPRVLRHVY